jgi:hypothetical protein
MQYFVINLLPFLSLLLHQYNIQDIVRRNHALPQILAEPLLYLTYYLFDKFLSNELNLILHLILPNLPKQEINLSVGLQNLQQIVRFQVFSEILIKLYVKLILLLYTVY